MSKGMTLEQMQARLAEIEARNKVLEEKASKVSEPGRIWPDVSKAVKDGVNPTSTIVLRGVNADPRRTVNLYPSQLSRIVSQLPSIVEGVLSEKNWTRYTFRSEEERSSVKAVLADYLGKGKA